LFCDHDISNIETTRAELDRVISSGGGLVVSLAQADFIDSSLVNTLFAANRKMQLRGRELVLHVHTAAIVRRVLDISGLASTLACASSIDDAVVIAGRVVEAKE